MKKKQKPIHLFEVESLPLICSNGGVTLPCDQNTLISVVGYSWRCRLFRKANFCTISLPTNGSKFGWSLLNRLNFNPYYTYPLWAMVLHRAASILFSGPLLSAPTPF